jgi:hypothetical protein
MDCASYANVIHQSASCRRGDVGSLAEVRRTPKCVIEKETHIDDVFLYRE